jgi:hypothetical protein
MLPLKALRCISDFWQKIISHISVLSLSPAVCFDFQENSYEGTVYMEVMQSFNTEIKYGYFCSEVTIKIIHFGVMAKGCVTKNAKYIYHRH